MILIEQSKKKTMMSIDQALVSTGLTIDDVRENTEAEMATYKREEVLDHLREIENDLDGKEGQNVH